MIQVIGHVKEGQIMLPKQFREWMQSFEGKEFILTVKEYRATRSVRQNNYYWGVVIPHMVAGFVAAGNVWLNPANRKHCEMIHEVLIERFLSNGEDLVMPDGSVRKSRSSTTKANTKEFAEFIERVKAFAIDTMGITIPEAGEIFSDEV